MYTDDILLYRPIRQASDYQLLQQDVEALGKCVIKHLIFAGYSFEANDVILSLRNVLACI